MSFDTIDIIAFVTYFTIIVFIGLWVSRTKKGEHKKSDDYFLASRSLPWWAIGTSLIAANISAEQFIGMSGSGFVIGLGIASYEWMAALTLIVVAKFIMPVFLKKGIYTMPQFLEVRFDNRVRTGLAVFWLLVYIFVNLTSVLYLGALAIKTITGVSLIYGILGLAFFSALYSIWGGLKSVALTDVVHVIFLIGGGLITTILALNALGDGNGPIAGFAHLLHQAPEKFDMILSPSNPHYKELPGITVIVGGMWIANLNYWGFNQYIIQRGLAAKSIREAQRGLAFAGYLKLLIPLIVVIPGICAFALNADINKPDEAYPWLLDNFVVVGLRGVAFAALIAAVVSSLSSMINSTSTIFTLDIYKLYLRKTASERNLVATGRIVSFTALVIAVLVAPQLKNLEQAFQFIQEFTGFVSPGVVAIFLAGLFWKKTTANSVLWAAIATIPLSFVFKLLIPGMGFLNRMGVVFLILCIIIFIISSIEKKGKDPKALEFSKGLFHTGNRFNIAAIGIMVILAALYALFW